jgi:hypothetical protein
VLIDDAWQDMVEEYPMMEERGSKIKFHYFFPRFNNSVWYDPQIDLRAGASSLKSLGLIITLLIAIKAWCL